WIVFSANAGEKFTVAKKSWIQFNKGPHQFFIIAITDPKIIQDEFQNYFSDPEVALAKTIKEIEKSGFDAKNEFHRLILLSHSGYEKDEYWAKNFPNINWIIGAHSQKFTRTPLLEGKTKIVQALSQNHYLGEIKLDLTGNRDKDGYELHEMHDSLSKLLEPN